MNFNLIMSISIDQSLKVFQNSFHSFYIFWVQKCKNQRFVEKYLLVHFYQIEVQMFSNWSRLLKKHQKFEIWYTADFLRIFKNGKKPPHFSRILKIVSNTR